MKALRFIQDNWVPGFIALTAVLMFLCFWGLLINVGTPFGGFLTYYNVLTDEYVVRDTSPPSWTNSVFPQVRSSDRVMRIEGQEYSELGAKAIYQELLEQGRDSFTLAIYRHNPPSDFVVLLPIQHFSFVQLLELNQGLYVFGICFWLLALVLYRNNPSRSTNRQVAVTFCLFGLGFSLAHPALFWHDGLIARIVDLVLLCTGPLQGAFLFRLAIHFPSVLIKKQWLRYFIEILVFLAAFLIAGSYLASRYFLWTTGHRELTVWLDHQGYYYSQYLFNTGGVLLLLRFVYTYFFAPLSTTNLRDTKKLWLRFFASFFDKIGIDIFSSIRDKKIAKAALIGLIPPTLVLTIIQSDRLLNTNFGFFFEFAGAVFDIRLFGMFAAVMVAYLMLVLDSFERSPRFFFLVLIFMVTAVYGSVIYPLIFASNRFHPAIEDALLLLAFFISNLFWAYNVSLGGVFSRVFHFKRLQYESVNDYSRRLLEVSEDLERLEKFIPKALAEVFETEFQALWLYENDTMLFRDTSKAIGDLQFVSNLSEMISDKKNFLIIYREEFKDWLSPLYGSLCNVVMLLKDRQEILGLLGMGLPPHQYNFDKNRDERILELIAQNTTLFLLTGRQVKAIEKERIEKLQAENKVRQTVRTELHDHIQQYIGSSLPSVITYLTDKQINPELRQHLEKLQQRNTIINELLDLTCKRLEETPENVNTPQFLIEHIEIISQAFNNLHLKVHFLNQVSEKLQIKMSIDKQSEIIFKVHEMLSNIEEHAEASEARLEFVHQPEHGLQLSIRDNGKGISDADVELAGINGRRGIRESKRFFEGIGGIFSIQKAEQQGTLILMQWPLDIYFE